MKTNSSGKHALYLLKGIGVILFIWILSKIDKASILETIAHANGKYLLLSFCVLFLIYAAKNVRWHRLVHSGGVKVSMHEAWRIFMIGIFLASITPGKTGELGKAPYLANAGMSMKRALLLSLLDRLFDVLCISVLFIAAVGILFGMQTALIVGGIETVGGILLLIFWKKIETLQKLITPELYIPIGLATLCAWTLFYTWSILIARSVGIDVPILTMAAILTITGILALLPIAPAGLGTREAALITLLAPFGVEPERAVAFSFLIFISIMLSGIPGAIYWIKGVKIAAHPLQ